MDSFLNENDVTFNTSREIQHRATIMNSQAREIFFPVAVTAFCIYQSVGAEIVIFTGSLVFSIFFL